jgi:hypothetical protein
VEDQIEAGLVEIHCLNNLLHPIPRPALAYPNLGPQVIVAEDDGMEVDGLATAAPPQHEDVEDEELGPVSDEDGEVIFDEIRRTSLQCSKWSSILSFGRFFCVSINGKTCLVIVL